MRTLPYHSRLISRVSLSFHPIVYGGSSRRNVPCFGLRFYSDDEEEGDGFEDESDLGRGPVGPSLYKRIRYPQWENQVNAVENYRETPVVDIDRYSERIIPHEMILDEYNANDVTQQEKPPSAIEMGMIIPVRIVDMISHPKYVTVEPTMEQYTQQFPFGILPRKEISRKRYPPAAIHTEIEPGDEYKMVVLQVIENLDGSGRMTPVVSLRRTAPILPESFQPATLAVFNVPQAMSEPYIRNYFLNYGPILGYRAFPAAHPDRPHLRTYTRIIFERKCDAVDAIKDLRRTLVPLVVDGQTIEHVRLKAKFDVYEGDSHRRELQQELLEEHQQSMEWWTATPQTQYLRRKCYHEYLRYLMPHWDTEEDIGDIE